MQEEINNQENLGNRALSTAYKLGGWHLRLKMIGTIIMSLIGLSLFSFGIYLLIIGNENPWGSIGGGVMIFLLGALGTWFNWWRSKSLVQGRYY